MVHSSFLTALGVAALTSTASALVANNNTNPDKIYSAVFEKEILGSLVFWPTNNYATVGVGLEKFPLAGGPFKYEINELPVDQYGDCPSPSGPLDYTNGSMSVPSLSRKRPGDLSGNHGMINGTSVAEVYIDPSLSLDPESPMFVGGRSIVVRYANSSILTCANVTEETKLHPRKGSAKMVAKFAGMNPFQEIANGLTGGLFGGNSGGSNGGSSGGGLLGEITGGLAAGLSSIFGLR